VLDEERRQRLKEAGQEFSKAEEQKSQAVDKLRDAVVDADGDVSVTEAADIADVSQLAVLAFRRPEDD